jgi:List-Bact-rpt repeat protein
VAWMQDPDGAQTSTQKEIMFSRSLNGGQSFGAPINLSNSPGNSLEARIAVGPTGTIYVVWDEGSPSRRIALARSLDGGSSFETPRTIAGVATPPGCPPGSVGNCDTVYPSLAVDPANGNVYVVWHDLVGSAPQILFSRSVDGGNVFSAPVNVSNAPIHAHCASITVGPSGKILIAYESRKDLSDHKHDAMFVQSTTAGTSFSTPLNLSHTPPATFSDYPWAVEAPDGTIAVGWEDNSGGGALDAVVAVSTNGGAGFGPTVNLSNNPGSTSTELVTLFGPDGTLYVIWEDYASGTAEVLLRRGTRGTTGGPPAFTVGPTTTSPEPVGQGATATITTTVTDTGGAASGIIVDIEVYNAAGTQVLQRILSGQNFQAGEAKTLQTTWPVSASQATGVYTVRIGVFSGNWATLYTWNNDAARITVGTGGSGPFTLTVVRAGSGSGTVTSSPPGINCGTDCSEAYASGTPVTLTAAAAAGSAFTGWAGACTGTGACSVTMTANTSVTAGFAPAGGGPPAFTVGPTTTSPEPVGQGATATITTTVTDTGGAASGIIVDIEVYNAADTRVLQRILSGQSFQAGETKTLQTTWPVSASQATGVYTVKIGVFSSNFATLYTWNNDAARITVGTGGGSGPFTLTVGRTGSGSGTVTSSPAGINCGTDCSEAYASGTPVTLTAAAAAGSAFTGWAGACSGTGACSVTMTTNTSVTAGFAPAGGGPPAFTVGPTSASPNPVARGATTTITTAVTDTGGAASGIIVDIEVYNAAGTQVLQRVLSGQNFQAGERKTLQTTWPVSAGQPTGVYTVKIGIFSSDWATLYTWENQAATITVN